MLTSEMDTKIESKEENPLLVDVESHNDREFSNKNAAMNTNSDAVLLDNDCKVTVKTETKPEAPFLSISSEYQRGSFTKHPVETVTDRNFCGIFIKTETKEQTLISDFDCQEETKFIPQFPVMNIKNYNSNHEIKEPRCMEAESSSLCVNIMDEDFASVKSPRLCSESVFDDSNVKSPLLSAEDSEKDTHSYNGNNLSQLESQESYITELTTVEQHFHLEQSDRYNNGGETCDIALYTKSKNLFHESESDRFTVLSDMRGHNSVHQNKKPNSCETNDQMYSMIRKGRKPHKCQICHSSFTHLARLKVHTLTHEDNKPISHKCEICNKDFDHLSSLKNHIVIHDEKRLHKCKVCDKSFRYLSRLKLHNLTHEDKEPKSHKCEICNRRFRWLLNLKNHIKFHEDRKPFKCQMCDRSFTRLTHLKIHNLTHEEKRPHKCEICDKSFTCLNILNSHILTHGDTKPHKCEICGKSFKQLAHLKTHNLIHEGKRDYKCEICNRSFIQLIHLKSHSLTHVH